MLFLLKFLIIFKIFSFSLFSSALENKNNVQCRKSYTRAAIICRKFGQFREESYCAPSELTKKLECHPLLKLNAYSGCEVIKYAGKGLSLGIKPLFLGDQFTGKPCSLKVHSNTKLTVHLGGESFDFIKDLDGADNSYFLDGNESNFPLLWLKHHRGIVEAVSIYYSDPDSDPIMCVFPACKNGSSLWLGKIVPISSYLGL